VKGSIMAKTKTEQLQDIVEAYRVAGESWPATARQIGAWAIRERLWHPEIKDQVVSGRSKPATRGRIKTSQFEEDN